MIVVILILIISFLLYYRGTKNFNYWKKKGISYRQPVPFFGNSLKKYLRKQSPTDQISDIFRSYPDEKCVGCFESNQPVLILRDPELIKQVLVTDFRYFYAKGMNRDQTEPLLNNLFSADGDLWKVLRQKISTAFTSGKFKAMFPVLLEQAKKLEKISCKASEKCQEVDVRELMAQYTTDGIVACGFGVEANTLDDDSSIFRQLGKRIFNIKLRDHLVFLSKMLAGDMFKDLKLFAPEIENCVTDITKSIFEARNNKPIDRKDFIDVLLRMQGTKTLIAESFTKRDKNGDPVKCEILLDEMTLIAQVFILFGAGYETTGAGMSFTLNQLAYNRDIQNKCQAEIDEVLKRHGKICYEAVCEMKYLEMVLKEGLRMYPPLGFLTRQCVENYTFPGIDLSLDKGVIVIVPLQALQNDVKYFEQPDKFMPERFDPVNVNFLNKFAYLPFGAGPRVCIGMRFGILESLTGLATILSKCTVVPSVNSRRNLVTDPTIALVQNVQGGIPLKFVKRSTIITC